MIAPFEYITVLISIILGMGITQIVTGIASLVLRWERVKLYWPHTLLVVLLFIIHIQEWWAVYEMRNFKLWRLATFLFIVLYPVNLYILARILFPLSLKAKVIDLKEFYFRHYRRFFLFFIILDALAIVDNVFISGYTWKDQVLQLVVMTILSVFVLTKPTKEWVHQLLVAMLVIITILTIVVTWQTLVIENVV